MTAWRKIGVLTEDQFQVFFWGGEYRSCSPTAVQAWQPCPLWEPSHSHPILVLTKGFAVFFVRLCTYCIFVYFLCSFSTLILLVGSFDL